MIVVMHDDFDPDLQAMVRTVTVVEPTKGNATLHNLAGFVSGCKQALWPGSWVIYCGY